MTEITRRLVNYSMAAGAGVVMSGMPANAEVVFTPANFTLSNHALKIDFNQDGQKDLELFNYYYSAKRLTRWLSVQGPGPFRVVGGPLAGGAAIGAGSPFDQHRSQMAFAYNYYYYGIGTVTGVRGSWANVTDQFLGVKFQINGGTHYGWVRLTVVAYVFNYPVITATISGYAYESVANKTITTPTAWPPKQSSSHPVGQQNLMPATLGLLALGDSGLAAWRREEVLY